VSLNLEAVVLKIFSGIIAFMDYKNLLKQHGLKATPQRVGLLSIMQEIGHINIDDMYIEIQKQFPSISLATLYKNIRVMIDATLVDEVKIPSQKSKFEIKKSPHGHLVCKRCGICLDMMLKTDDLMYQMVQKSGFYLMSMNVVLSGLCPDCQGL
jgi:Fur family transcriptional regulator, peroxide stress response regulator